MRIEMPRLIIRSFSAPDIPDYARIVADPQVTKYLADGSPHSYEEAETYILDVIRRDRESGISRYAVVRKAERDLIGFCGFKELDDHIDFGWRYAPHAWGKGYGTEAALAVLGYGLNTLKLHAIAAQSFVANIASLRIIEKLGFQRVEQIECYGKKMVRYYRYLSD